MATKQQTGKVSEGKDGDDLSTILDQSQRADLTLLLAAITDSMRNLLLQTFDPNAGLDASYSREGMSEEEKLMSTDPQSADVEAMDKQRKLKEEYEKDLSSMKMKILKRQSLQAFDDWREQVLVRIGEVVNSRSTVKQQVETTSLGQVLPETPKTVGKIVEAPERGPNLKFKDLYPPIKNPLTKLSMEQRTLVLHSVLLLLLSLKHYNAPSRVLLLILTSSLKLPLKTFEHDEYVTAKGLLEGAKEMTAEEEKKKKMEESKDSRKWKVGLATAAGAALIGVTGGLAAPLVAAGVGSVMGGLGLGATSAATYLGSVAGSTYLVGGLFGAYGGRMTGNMMDNYAREVEDFEFLPVHSQTKTSENEKEAAKQASDHDHKLRVSICISGWLTEKSEVLKPWRVLGTGADVYALKYELEAMLNLGNAMKGFIESAAWGYAQKKLIASSIFAELSAAMWPIGLLKAARVVDNPFQIAKTRSEKAGEVLADALINRAQGERPVTLIGYSLGARVIYTCLMSLAKRHAFGLVENAVLVGGPIPSDTSDWRMLRAVVSGRLVNVYSTNDYILGFLYRTSSLQYGVAGLQAVQGLPGVENVDVSDDISGHLRYRYLMGSILKKIGFEDLNLEAIEQEKQALLKMEEEEQKKSLEAQQKRLLRRQSNGGKEDEEAEADQEASEIEKDVKARTQKSMLTKAMEYFYTPKSPTTANKAATSGDVQGGEKVVASNNETKSKVPGEADTSQSLSRRAYSVLPSMPHIGRSSPEQAKQVSAGSTSQTTKPADTTQQSQSYTSRAAGLIPSLPKNLPSMPKSLPSMPGLSGRSKAQPTDRTEETQRGTDSTKVSQRKASSQANAADRPSRPNLNPKDDVAGTNTRDTKQAPVIHQVTTPDTEKKAGGQSPSNRLQRQASGQHASRSKKLTEEGEKSAGERIVVQDGSERAPEERSQSYASYAASYLPSIPKSMPAIPGWSSMRKPPPKLDRKDSGVKSPPPKLEHRSSGIKSPPPKLGPRRTSSSMKRVE